MKKVFLLQNSYEKNNGFEETKIIGIFSTYQKAEETIVEYRIKKGFVDHPDDFFIDEYLLDEKNWSEGFVCI